MTDDAILWPPGADPEVFTANLAALAERSPELAERLCWPVDGSHVHEDASGAVSYRLHGADFPLALGGAEVERRVEAAFETPLADTPTNARRVLVFGVGLGELVTRALERGLSATAWDRDPWLLRLALGRRDYQVELQSGVLRLALGADLLALAWTNATVLAHPFLEQVYARERALLEREIGPRRALLCAGGLYVDSLGRALEARGYCVWTCEAERLSREELEHTAHVLCPELVASINYRDGLADFARAIDAKLLVWEIDPATSPIRSSEAFADGAARERIFSYRRESVDAFRAAGFRHAEYLPLAADAELRHPLELTVEESAHYGASVSFVGSSMAASAPEFVELFLASFARWRGSPAARSQARAILEEIVCMQRADFRHFVARELLEGRAPGFARWCAATGEPSDPVVLLGELSASEKRLALLANLGARLAGRAGAGLAPNGGGESLHVWGDAGWERIAHHGIRYRGPASHVRDLSRIYCASSINLDVGRLYQSDIATMRTFDVLSCGGFALVEHNDALAELFELGVELETYRDFPELWEKVAHFLAHPAEARSIAERGRAAVLARHTFTHRLDHMLRSFERGEAPAADAC